MVLKRTKTGFVIVVIAAMSIIVIKIVRLLIQYSNVRDQTTSFLDWHMVLSLILSALWSLTSFAIMAIDLWWQNKLCQEGRPISVDIKPLIITIIVGILSDSYLYYAGRIILIMSLPIILVTVYSILRISFRLAERN